MNVKLTISNKILWEFSKLGLKLPLSLYTMLRIHNIAWHNFFSLFLNTVKRGTGWKQKIKEIAVFPIIFVTDCRCQARVLILNFIYQYKFLMVGWLGKVCKGFSVSLPAVVDHTLEYIAPPFLKFLYVFSFFLMVQFLDETHIYLNGSCKLVFIHLSHDTWRSPFMNNPQIKSQFQNLISEQF